jgi:uncharacterized protein YPO0396
MSSVQQIERENYNLNLHYDHLRHVNEQLHSSKQEKIRLLNKSEQYSKKLEQEIAKLKQELAIIQSRK